MSTIHLSVPPQADNDRSIQSIALTVPEPPRPTATLAVNRTSKPTVQHAKYADSGVSRSILPANESGTTEVAYQEGGQHAKRRPPSLVIDQSLTALPSLHENSNSSANSTSSESQKASPPSTIVSGKPAKSAKEIIQGLALHCVSPGLPPMNHAMMENVMRTKAIEKQQRQLIASRQKPSDGSSDLTTVNGNRHDKDELMEDESGEEHEEVVSGNESWEASRSEDMNRMRIRPPGLQLPTKEPRSAMKGRSLAYDKSSSVEETGRRAPRPASIRIVDPARYHEGDYERAIRSAPLVNSMRNEYSEESQHIASGYHQIDRRFLPKRIDNTSRRPVSSPMLQKDRLAAQKFRYSDSSSDPSSFLVPHSANPALSSTDRSLRTPINSDRRRLSARALGARPDVYGSACVLPLPPRKRAKHGREPRSTRRPPDPDCECEECRMASSEESHGVRHNIREEDPGQGWLQRQRFLELCAEMWDLFHE
ncbi:hypothetical protein V1525DRAFT_448901 [Lipomyces kononenkoae]|uniref:Uncharacterized protein n=1 Tax=Lipomyces kononenkoae TaxID=34357 RepID=A0ACC3T774_LIPKO